MNRFAKFSATSRVIISVLLPLSISLVLAVILLNGFVKRQMNHSYIGTVKTLFNSLEYGVKGSLEKGQMKNFQKLLGRQKNIAGVLDVSLYDKFGVLNLSSNTTDKQQKLPIDLSNQINKSQQPILVQDASKVMIYAPQRVGPDCIRCHPHWQKGSVGGILSLTYDLTKLNQTILHLQLLMSCSALALLLLISIIIFMAMRKMLSLPVNKIINNLNNSAVSVGDSAHKSSRSSRSLADNSCQQASSLEQTSASLEELSSMTRMNADNATRADELMTDTNQIMTESNQVMEQMQDAMQKIAESNKETTTILKTIDQIAFQTNLLALNAAVEAARAGEVGAGFAVVADEVRNLALRTAEAAKSVSTLLEGTNQRVTTGVEFSKNAGEAFLASAEKTSKASSIINEIATASKEQATGIQQLVTAVTELDNITQANAADADNASSVASEMESQFDRLKNDIAFLTKLVRGDNYREKPQHKKPPQGDPQPGGQQLLENQQQE